LAYVLGYSIPCVLLFFVVDIGIKKSGLSVRNRLLIALVFQVLLTIGLAWANYDPTIGLTPIGYVATGITATLLSMALVVVRPSKASNKNKDAAKPEVRGDLRSSAIDTDPTRSVIDGGPLRKPDGESGSNPAGSISMQSDPLDADEHLRLIAFLVICALVSWAAFFFGGFIPALLLAYGYVMMRTNSDFNHVDVTVKYAKLYFKILLGLSAAATALLFILALASAAEINSDLFADIGYVRWDFVLVPLLLFVIFYGCVAATEHWYYLPLKRHNEWVIAKGAFSRKPKDRDVRNRSATERSTSRDEKPKQFSVADELAKWAKLREDGLVSEKEFEEARSRLLNAM
jgi:hypothetical protein